jgi:hypothetical protein
VKKIYRKNEYRYKCFIHEGNFPPWWKAENLNSPMAVRSPVRGKVFDIENDKENDIFNQCCGSGLVGKLLGLLNPDPLVRGTDPDPSVIKQK